MKKSLEGKKFGRLTVIKQTNKRKNGNIVWQCECNCGSNVIVYATTSSLNSGDKKSCGCLGIEQVSNINKTHSLSGTRLYKIYNHIKSRCYNSKDKNFKYYGEKGVLLCDKWLNNFEEFYNWSMDNGYEDNLTIDRINVNGNYEPSNCRWVDMKTQANNRTSSIKLNILGNDISLAECCRKYGLSYNKYQKRRKNGHDIEKEINEIIQNKQS
ncbi:MAG: hypothetical protein SPI06_07870 [Terrisporobacter sp.]|uniref:hypothetical protein n=1 Tax=Terrisporobacter sp. TaxID=1965305 RepID=UPI002A9201AC|nr:hypothetical protein [Terrisporobacter sp.]MDY6153313.1 hypothetical protein [Terrisporobacter sp.]